MAMKGRPAVLAQLEDGDDVGVLELAAALASIWKRWRLSSSRVPSTVRVLTATSRSRTSSQPR